MRTFTITDEQESMIKDWQENHECKFRSKNGADVMWVPLVVQIHTSLLLLASASLKASSAPAAQDSISLVAYNEEDVEHETD